MPPISRKPLEVFLHGGPNALATLSKQCREQGDKLLHSRGSLKVSTSFLQFLGLVFGQTVLNPNCPSAEDHGDGDGDGDSDGDGVGDGGNDDVMDSLATDTSRDSDESSQSQPKCPVVPVIKLGKFIPTPPGAKTIMFPGSSVQVKLSTMQMEDLQFLCDLCQLVTSIKLVPKSNDVRAVHLHIFKSATTLSLRNIDPQTVHGLSKMGPHIVHLILRRSIHRLREILVECGADNIQPTPKIFEINDFGVPVLSTHASPNASLSTTHQRQPSQHESMSSQAESAIQEDAEDVMGVNEHAKAALHAPASDCDHDPSKPNQDQRWPVLQILDASDNSLSDIDDSLQYAPQIRSLFLNQNRLTEISENLRYATALHTLHLSYNQITSLSMFEEIAARGGLRNLTSLAISNNGIESLHGIQYLKNLMVLDASKNPISRFHEITEFLAPLPNLREVNLLDTPLFLQLDAFPQVLALFGREKWESITLNNVTRLDGDDRRCVHYFLRKFEAKKMHRAHQEKQAQGVPVLRVKRKKRRGRDRSGTRNQAEDAQSTLTNSTSFTDATVSITTSTRVQPRHETTDALNDSFDIVIDHERPPDISNTVCRPSHSTSLLSRKLSELQAQEAEILQIGKETEQKYLLQKELAFVSTGGNVEDNSVNATQAGPREVVLSDPRDDNADPHVSVERGAVADQEEGYEDTIESMANAFANKMNDPKDDLATSHRLSPIRFDASHVMADSADLSADALVDEGDFIDLQVDAPLQPHGARKGSADSEPLNLSPHSHCQQDRRDGQPKARALEEPTIPKQRREDGGDTHGRGVLVTDASGDRVVPLSEAALHSPIRKQHSQEEDASSHGSPHRHHHQQQHPVKYAITSTPQRKSSSRSAYSRSRRKKAQTTSNSEKGNDTSFQVFCDLAEQDHVNPSKQSVHEHIEGVEPEQIDRTLSPHTPQRPDSRPGHLLDPPNTPRKPNKLTYRVATSPAESPGELEVQQSQLRQKAHEHGVPLNKRLLKGESLLHSQSPSKRPLYATDDGLFDGVVDARELHVSSNGSHCVVISSPSSARTAERGGPHRNSQDGLSRKLFSLPNESIQAPVTGAGLRKGVLLDEGHDSPHPTQQQVSTGTTPSSGHEGEVEHAVKGADCDSPKHKQSRTSSQRRKKSSSSDRSGDWKDLFVLNSQLLGKSGHSPETTTAEHSEVPAEGHRFGGEDDDDSSFFFVNIVSNQNRDLQRVVVLRGDIMTILLDVDGETLFLFHLSDLISAKHSETSGGGELFLQFVNSMGEQRNLHFRASSDNEEEKQELYDLAEIFALTVKRNRALTNETFVERAECQNCHKLCDPQRMGASTNRCNYCGSTNLRTIRKNLEPQPAAERLQKLPEHASGVLEDPSKQPAAPLAASTQTSNLHVSPSAQQTHSRSNQSKSSMSSLLRRASDLADKADAAQNLRRIATREGSSSDQEDPLTSSQPSTRRPSLRSSHTRSISDSSSVHGDFSKHNEDSPSLVAARDSRKNEYDHTLRDNHSSDAISIELEQGSMPFSTVSQLLNDAPWTPYTAQAFVDVETTLRVGYYADSSLEENIETLKCMFHVIPDYSAAKGTTKLKPSKKPLLSRAQTRFGILMLSTNYFGIMETMPNGSPWSQEDNQAAHDQRDSTTLANSNASSEQSGPHTTCVPFTSIKAIEVVVSKQAVLVTLLALQDTNAIVEGRASQPDEQARQHLLSFASEADFHRFAKACSQHTTIHDLQSDEERSPFARQLLGKLHDNISVHFMHPLLFNSTEWQTDSESEPGEDSQPHVDEHRRAHVLQSVVDCKEGMKCYAEGLISCAFVRPKNADGQVQHSQSEDEKSEIGDDEEDTFSLCLTQISLDSLDVTMKKILDRYMTSFEWNPSTPCYLKLSEADPVNQSETLNEFVLRFTSPTGVREFLACVNAVSLLCEFVEAYVNVTAHPQTKQ